MVFFAFKNNKMINYEFIFNKITIQSQQLISNSIIV